MVLNVGIGVLVGSIPLLGDAFDIAWKANRRNYALMSRHIAEPSKHTWRDWLFLLAIGLVLMLVLAVPVVVLAWLVHWAVCYGMTFCVPAGGVRGDFNCYNFKESGRSAAW